MDSMTQKLIRRCLINRDCTIDDICHFKEFQELVGSRVINPNKMRPLQTAQFKFEYAEPLVSGQQLVYDAHKNEQS